MKFVAIINVPGYLPMDDEPPVFDTAQEAWVYLADEREHSEDSAPFDADAIDAGKYSDTWTYLLRLAAGEHRHNDPSEVWPTNADGTGTVYGETPGREGNEHDLGLAYTVRVATPEEEEDDEGRD